MAGNRARNRGKLMLCQFTFKNHRSYRDETVLSLQATPMKEFERSLIECEDGQRFLPVAVVYGPNAGGKSNLIEAFKHVNYTVTRPIYVLGRGVGGPEMESTLVPLSAGFVFDGTSSSDPSEYELYYRSDGYEFRYALSIKKGEILYEGLWRRKLGASRAATLFEREGSEVALGVLLRKEGVPTDFNPLLPYFSFLYMNCDLPVVADAASWFLTTAIIDFNSFSHERILEKQLDEEDSPKIARFLKAVDVHVEGFRVEEDPVCGRRVLVKHVVNGKEYELRLCEESSGTQKLMGLATIVFNALEEGSALVVDELDAKLHPKLLRYLVLLFKDPEVNKKGAQLIFTSQDISTMRNDVFRRDEIWFAARDENEVSQLWSLADIHEANGNLVSSKAAFDKQYLAGRYGADPYLTRIEEWE